MTAIYDVIIIGGGPGGYVAAIRCAQLGLSTACIDDQSDQQGKPCLGGTCLNVGCIPSKALLDSSAQFQRLQQLSMHGISSENPTIDIAIMQQRKRHIVSSLTAGVKQLLAANKVTAIHGRGRLMADNNVAVFNPANGDLLDTIKARSIILAPGAKPIELPTIAFDSKLVVDSTAALAFERVPSRLGVIGAGVIGLELGSVWNRLGSEVILLEAMDQFLASADHQIAAEAARYYKKQGLDIRLGANVSNVNAAPNGVAVQYQQKGEQHTIEVERVVVAVGRKPATAGLLASDCGVTTDARGFIEVDDYCHTAAAGVWAIGDAVRGPMLAHKSAAEGVAVAERISGGVGQVDFNIIPWVIYTSPEIAWVGKTENQLKAEGVPIKTGVFPFAATGRAKAMAEPIGSVKIIAHAETDRIVGVHIIGPHVSELIAECVVAMSFHASAEDIARIVHAHPTLSEAVHEAALSVDNRAIHKFG